MRRRYGLEATHDVASALRYIQTGRSVLGGCSSKCQGVVISEEVVPSWEVLSEQGSFIQRDSQEACHRRQITLVSFVQNQKPRPQSSEHTKRRSSVRVEPHPLLSPVSITQLLHFNALRRSSDIYIRAAGASSGICHAAQFAASSFNLQQMPQQRVDNGGGIS